MVQILTQRKKRPRVTQCEKPFSLTALFSPFKSSEEKSVRVRHVVRGNLSSQQEILHK